MGLCEYTFFFIRLYHVRVLNDWLTGPFKNVPHHLICKTPRKQVMVMIRQLDDVRGRFHEGGRFLKQATKDPVPVSTPTVCTADYAQKRTAAEACREPSFLLGCLGQPWTLAFTLCKAQNEAPYLTNVHSFSQRAPLSISWSVDPAKEESTHFRFLPDCSKRIADIRVLSSGSG